MTYPFIDPVLLRLGPLEIRWYGLMNLVGFAIAYFIIRSEFKRRNGPLPAEMAGDFLFYLILGLMLGARIGYVIFYNFDVYLKQPWEIFAVWRGGMSFHGGMIGMIITGWMFSRSSKVPFLELADIGALSVPMGLMAGRIGNFINGELYGRVSSVPWAIVFPDGGPHPRHPSQLYEAFFEGPILFLVLWILRRRLETNGLILALFIMLYGFFRFCIEFFREPDVQLGYLYLGLTMGQILCLFMMIMGGLLFLTLQRRSRR
ncbi:MAG: prolipoprotein diacylglyceryl transferase [Syntrophaceae bacterium]|nr:prolipoprotein diacylglyceryl transferase [Syntrophaceae bacterium]